jgi:uncharacterized protein (TIGR02217 family)
MTSFHEVRFPTDISRRASGGPERRTQVVTLGSGFEQRNQQWADSRRRYQAGYGVKSIDDIHTALAFFEERRGRLHGFRWKDWADYKSCAPRQPPDANDQTLGIGDGARTEFQLIKVYGSAYAPWTRDIAKPVPGTVLVAVDGITQTAGMDYTADETAGLITFTTAPESGLSVTAGYEFDVPVRFDTDRIDVDLSHFEAGAMPDIPIMEIRL